MESSIYADPVKATALRILSASSEEPLMIPGAREVRVGVLKREQTAAMAPVLPVRQSGSGNDAPDDRGRAEHQIEGGGAVKERRSGRYRTWVAKIRHAFQRTAIPRRPQAQRQS